MNLTTVVDACEGRSRLSRSFDWRWHRGERIARLAVLHVIDEGAKLGQHLTTVGVVEEYSRRRWCEPVQDLLESSISQGRRCHRLGQLREPHPLDCAAEHGGEIVGDKAT